MEQINITLPTNQSSASQSNPLQGNDAIALVPTARLPKSLSEPHLPLDKDGRPFLRTSVAISLTEFQMTVDAIRAQISRFISMAQTSPVVIFVHWELALALLANGYKWPIAIESGLKNDEIIVRGHGPAWLN